MRLQILSDLHLEQYPDWQPEVATGADLLVLAGDIGSYQRGSKLEGLGHQDFGLGRFSPRIHLERWKQVLYVPGNHEYDGLPFTATRQRLQHLCAELGITWLDRQQVVIDGVRFIGTTLWSDFDALGQREKAFRAANYYLRKYSTVLEDGNLMLAERMRQEALLCQDWLRSALNQTHAGPTVVVTHYAPSLHCADPRYGLTPGTAGFCNALDDLLPQADVWIHGHLHCPKDQIVRGCHLVANPRGYASKGEQARFEPTFTIDVMHSRPRPELPH